MANSAETKLDQILAHLKQVNARLESIEVSLETQKQFVTSFQKSALERYVENSNVEEACGVDPSKIQRNQLMGESSTRTDKEDVYQKVNRQNKQTLGAKMYAAYIWFYAIAMALSCFNLIPVFDWEKTYDEQKLMESSIFMGRTVHIPVILSVLYVFVIFGIQNVMKDRKPFNLRYPLAFWSLLIGLFSLFGSLRTVPVLLEMIRNKGVGEVICGDTRRDWLVSHPAGLWTFLFILSKIPELIDTLFIVLRKRKLITLHWYHHITVMLFCWHSWATYSQTGIFFAAMNLTVHGFMYIFYFLAALGYRPTYFAQYITIIQILQMFFGTGITAYIVYHMTFIEPQNVFTPKHILSLDWNLNHTLYVDTSNKCKVNPGNAISGLCMYASYLWLFCVFFFYAYLKPNKGENKEKEE